MDETASDKKKPSGAQNRKRKLEKEENIKKLTSPIVSFFRPGKSSSTTTGQSEEIPTSEEAPTLDESVVTSEFSSSARFSENMANDPAFWPQILPDKLRSSIT